MNAMADACPRSQLNPTPWRFLLVVLGAAFSARVAVVLWGDFIYHNDVVYQYYEPAWRLLTGNGYIHWELFYGARPQLIPTALALVMGGLRELGIDHPTALRTAVEVFLCGLSILVPWGMYAFARAAFDESIGRVALVLGTLWHEFLALAGQPLSELLALVPLLWAFALAQNLRSPRRCSALGLLLVAACALRFQYAPLALYLVALTWPRMESRKGFVGAMALALGLLAAFDMATVGGPVYRSYVANFVFNLVFAQTETMVVAGAAFPWYYYPLALASASGGLVAVALPGVGLQTRGPKRMAYVKWLLVPVALVLAMHSASQWQEYRFVLATVPFWLIGLAAVFAALWQDRGRMARMATALLGLWFMGAAAAGLLAKLPGQATVYGPGPVVPLVFVGAPDPRLSFADRLARDDSLIRLAEIGINLGTGLGQFHLGWPVPIYTEHAIVALRACQFEPRDYASHAIVPPGNPIPAGFRITLAETSGWRLVKQPDGWHDGRELPPWTQQDFVSILGIYGTTARRVFEPGSKGEGWPQRLWARWAGTGNWPEPLPRFRVRGAGPLPSRAPQVAPCAQQTLRDG